MIVSDCLRVTVKLSNQWLIVSDWLRVRIPTKVMVDGLKRNMSRGNSLSDELNLSSVLGDTRAYLHSPVWG